MSRSGHDTGPGLLVLWPGPKKVCTLDDVGLHGGWICHQLPMVFLGLFTYFFNKHIQRLYWRFTSFWPEGGSGPAESRFTSCVRSLVFILSGEISLQLGVGDT